MITTEDFFEGQKYQDVFIKIKLNLANEKIVLDM